MSLSLRKNWKARLLAVGVMIALVAPLHSLAVHAAVAPHQVQSGFTQSSSGKVVRLTLPNTAAPGNLIAVSVVWNKSGTAHVTDNRGNTYYAATAKTGFGLLSSNSMEVFYAKNIAGGSTTITATFSQSVSSGKLYVHEYAGLDKVNPLEGNKTASGTGSTLDSGALNTTHAHDLLFAAGASSSGVRSGGAGFTVQALNGGNIIEDMYVTNTGSYHATASQSPGAWAMQLVAFRADPALDDTVPPSVPAGLTGQSISPTQASLSWQAATDDVGVIGYRIYRDGTAIATTANTTYQDNSLTPASTYQYTVSALDAAGNVSDQSDPVLVTTPSPVPDTQPPSVPTGLHTSAISDTQTTLAWTASTDNVSVVNYRIYRDGAHVGSSNNTQFTDTGLTAQTTYNYTVAAVDAAGNVSNQSAPLSVTTTATPPPSGWPDATNTGVPAGITLHTCPTSITTTATYDACQFNGDVVVHANNVTITRSLIKGHVEAGGGTEQSGLSISDSTIDCGCQSTDSSHTPSAISESNYSLLRVNIMHSGHGAAVKSNVTIRDSYIHDLGGNTTAHKDGIYVGDGTNSVIDHNNVECNDGPAAGCTSAIGLLTDFSDVTYFTITNNLLNTNGSYCFYGEGGPGKSYHSNHITFTGNHFGRKDNQNCGYYGPVTNFNTSAPGMVWSNNVWDDTGQTIDPVY